MKVIHVVTCLALVSSYAEAINTSKSYLSDERKLGAKPLSVSGIRVVKGTSKSEDSPLGDFILGCIMICFALPMIWFNERKLVRIYKLIGKARKVVVKDIAINEVRGANDLKLIHATGKTVTHTPLSDESFGIHLDQTIKLKRTVEMEQWVEVQHERDNGHIDFSYRKEWSENLLDSSQFREKNMHTNPTEFPALSKEEIHNTV